jgi:hypothetical protein
MSDQPDLADLIFNKRLYIETLMKVQNKARKQVPFNLNPSQDIVWPYIDTPGARLLVLKARQMGSTTVYVGKFLADCLTVPGTVSVIASENEFATQRALARAHSLYNSIPTHMKPRMAHKSSYEITWPDMDSTMFITSAGSKLLVRGDTIHNFLATEISRWQDPEGAMAAAEEAVPLEGFIVMESTPWGEGDYFHTSIQSAIGGKSAYKFIFLPWWLDPEYRIPEGSELALDGDRGKLEFTPDEHSIMETHDLDEEQIRWRRRKIADRGLYFFQEYPEDPVTCFITSGEAVLDPARMDELAHMCYPAPGSFQSTQVWYPPIEGGVYLISADPTVGAHDKAAAVVWNIGEGMTHCATLWGLYEPEVFAGKLMELGKHYFNAEIQVEENGPGQAVLLAMKNYPNLGRRRNLVTGALTSKIGWLTTRASKPYMIAQMGREIHNIAIFDIEIIRQLRGLRWYGQDIVSVSEDDLAMAAMIGTSTCQNVGTVRRGFAGTYGLQK